MHTTLQVGANGNIYSGSADSMIRVWSGDDGTQLNTLVGHTNWV
jgi:WD40 repeat protein